MERKLIIVQLTNKYFSIFSGALRLSWRLHNITQDDKFLEKAFYFAEKSKAIHLLASLQESSAKSFAGIPQKLIEKRKNFKS